MLWLVLALAARGRLLRGELDEPEPATDGALDLSSPDELWDGSEGVELAGALDALWSANASAGTAVHALRANRTAGRHPMMHVFGLFNTGTNLLFDLLGKNFAAHDLAPWKQGQPGWKHAKPSFYFANYPHLKPQAGDVIIAIVRDPMSWLMSMKKAPYNLQGCIWGPDWTTRQCVMSCDGYCMQAHQGEKRFANIESVWNVYTKDYMGATVYGYSTVVMVRYEDLVTQTEVELKRIGDALGIQPYAQVVQQHAPAKAHGMSVGRAAALEKLRSKSYLGSYGSGDRPKACAQLDRSTMHELDYHDCDGW